MRRSLRNVFKQYDDTEYTVGLLMSFRMLILLVFLSGLKLLSTGVNVNNWQILGFKLRGFMEYQKKNLTNGNFHDNVLTLRNCIFFIAV